MAKNPQSENNPGHNRDPERIPMQWDDSPNAGFCPEHVEAQRKDPHSMLSLFRRLIALRREIPALTIGSYRALETGSDSTLAYMRERGGQKILVALNFGDGHGTLDLSGAGDEGDVLCSTNLDLEGRIPLGGVAVRPGEGIEVSPRP